MHGDASAGVGAGGRCDRSKMELLIRQVNAKKLPFACLSVYGTIDSAVETVLVGDTLLVGGGGGGEA